MTTFDTFWKEYPRKVGKKKALTSWNKVAQHAEQILEAVNRYKNTDQWKKDGGQYIPHPSTFLNQGRWEDEIVVKKEFVSKYAGL